MPRRRTPLAKAKATGQDKNHASRFKDRREPQSKGPLGKPPKWMVRKHQLEAWLRAPGHGDRGFRLMATSISD